MSLEMCFPGKGTHITCDICSQVGEHIFLVIMCSTTQEHTFLVICVAGNTCRGTHITTDMFPGQGNTYHWGYMFPA